MWPAFVMEGTMKYIIMCGGKYPRWQGPRQLVEIRGEPIVARTIRLLRERGVEDIAISSNCPEFERFGVPVLRHENGFIARDRDPGDWVDAFYPTEEPVCYVFGDVVFSPAAIKVIVGAQTDGIEFFASAPPFSPLYPKNWAEPFAFKVTDVPRFRRAIGDVKRLTREGKFRRTPIAWELWNVIRRGPGGDVNRIDFRTYQVINDYTCDIDMPQDAKLFDRIVE